MSRPESLGVPYFPVVVERDQKLKLIQAKFKLTGMGCIVELWTQIYTEGYALLWDEDAELLFSSEKGIELAQLREIVAFAADRGLFDKNLLLTKHVLTSHGIQKQWLSIVRQAHRKNQTIDPELCLLTDVELSTDLVQGKPSDRSINSGGNPADAPKTPEETPQSKAKQSKVNNIKEQLAARVENLTPEVREAWQSFCLEEAKRSGARKPAPYATKIFNDPERLAAWLDANKPPEPKKPEEIPPVCDSCGGPTHLEIPIEADKPPEAMCPKCKRLWSFDFWEQKWQEEKIMDISALGIRSTA